MQAATLRAGLEERLECRAKGAYPEANITWTLDGKKLNFTAKEVRERVTEGVWERGRVGRNIQTAKGGREEAGIGRRLGRESIII